MVTQYRDGGIDKSNDSINLLDVPMTCAELEATGFAYPNSVNETLRLDLSNVDTIFQQSLGPIPSGTYTQATTPTLGAVRISFGAVYPDGGRELRRVDSLSSGSISISDPVGNNVISGTFSSVRFPDAGLYSGGFTAAPCLYRQ